MKSTPVLLVLVLLVVLAGCSAPAPEGSASDKLHKSERAKRQTYTETSTINACTQSGCYSLPATITHSFAEDGKELQRVNQIYFDNGGFLSFDAAYIGGAATDSRGRVWTFSY